MKLTFANQLRGLAALAVVFEHYFGVFFDGNIRSQIGIALDPSALHRPWLADKMLALPAMLNYGPLGVSVFFMISGFVIMFSLSKLTSIEFIIQRAFRIFPTYWIGLLICFSFISLSSYYWGSNPQDSYPKNIWILNVILAHTVMWMPSVDFVNWTLAVEMKFYIISAFLFYMTKNPKRYLSLALIVMSIPVMVIYLYRHDIISISPNVYAFINEAKYIPFLFIGTCFYYFMNSSINRMEFLIFSSIFFCSFSLFMFGDGDFKYACGMSINYAAGAFVFSICYLLRKLFKPNVIIDFFADISYPLYLVHSVMGYVVMSILISFEMPMSICALVAFILSVLVSTILNRTIEKWSNRIGKSISKYYCGEVSNIGFTRNR